MANDRELWQDALVQIELSTSEASFRTWFRNTEIARRDGGDIFIAVPSKMVKEWLRDKHHKLILKALRDIDTTVRSVDYVVQKSVRTMPKQYVSKQEDSSTASLGLQDFYIDKRDNLNPRYVFETFVVGPFNQLAHAATQAVIQRPGLSYNPLFIYGSTGYGKTHLIQAVGNHFKKTHPNKKVFYITAERFTTDLISAIRTGKGKSFSDQYRQYDVLIIDDIQFIADKQGMQEELFHLFNALHDNNKQIVFSSDKHPNSLRGFEERLISRFNAGMTAEIVTPDLESRAAIIKKKSDQLGFMVPEDIILYVAEHIQGNIREIEGVLNTIICNTQLKGKPLNLQEVRQVMKNNIRPTRGFSTEDIVKKIAQFYEIDEKSIYEKTRKKEVVKPRQIVMYILREEYSVSYPSIGEKLGGRDHTTVIHSCEKIKEELKKSSALEHEIEQIKVLIQS